MKCIDCKYHSVLDDKHWCDFDRKKPKRIKHDDAMKGREKNADLEKLAEFYEVDLEYLKKAINY